MNWDIMGAWFLFNVMMFVFALSFPFSLTRRQARNGKIIFNVR